MVDLCPDAGIEECVAHATAGTCILVAGASGAGKTTIATLLAARLECGSLELDRFYRDRADVPTVDIRGEPQPQWDCPEAIDISLALAFVRAIIIECQSTIIVPRYSFETDARAGMESLHVPSNEHLIVEGALAHMLRPGCTLFDIPAMTVYVHAGRAERVRRIRERDRLNPRRTLEPQPVFAIRMSAMAIGEHAWVYPQRDNADVVICTEA
jgi:uridine kinase